MFFFFKRVPQGFDVFQTWGFFEAKDWFVRLDRRREETGLRGEVSFIFSFFLFFFFFSFLFFFFFFIIFIIFRATGKGGRGGGEKKGGREEKKKKKRKKRGDGGVSLWGSRLHVVDQASVNPWMAHTWPPSMQTPWSRQTTRSRCVSIVAEKGFNRPALQSAPGGCPRCRRPRKGGREGPRAWGSPLAGGDPTVPEWGNPPRC
jgi:hypothetical protein